MKSSLETRHGHQHYSARCSAEILSAPAISRRRCNYACRSRRPAMRETFFAATSSGRSDHASVDVTKMTGRIPFGVGRCCATAVNRTAAQSWIDSILHADVCTALVECTTRLHWLGTPGEHAPVRGRHGASIQPRCTDAINIATFLYFHHGHH